MAVKAVIVAVFLVLFEGHRFIIPGEGRAIDILQDHLSQPFELVKICRNVRAYCNRLSGAASLSELEYDTAPFQELEVATMHELGNLKHDCLVKFHDVCRSVDGANFIRLSDIFALGLIPRL